MFDKNTQSDKQITWLHNQHIGWDNGSNPLSSAITHVSPIPIMEVNISRYAKQLRLIEDTNDKYYY